MDYDYFHNHKTKRKKIGSGESNENDLVGLPKRNSVPPTALTRYFERRDGDKPAAMLVESKDVGGGSPDRRKASVPSLVYERRSKGGAESKQDIEECMRYLPKSASDADDYEYAIRLKDKYGDLKWKQLSIRLGVNEKTLIGRARRRAVKEHSAAQGVRAGIDKGGRLASREVKNMDRLDIKECVRILVDAGKDKASKDFGFHLKERYPYLTINEISKELDVNTSTMKSRIAALSAKGGGGSGLSVKECVRATPFDSAVDQDEVSYGIRLRVVYPHLFLSDIGKEIGVNKYTIQRRAENIRINAEHGVRSVDVAGLLARRQVLKSKKNDRPEIGEGVVARMKSMCDAAHAKLRDIERKMSTTAIGVDSKGGYYLASSAAALKKASRDWASENAIGIVGGVGHAEEKLLREVSDLVHVEVSRAICLECEVMLLARGVRTTTEVSGKLSQKAERDVKKQSSSSK